MSSNRPHRLLWPTAILLALPPPTVAQQTPPGQAKMEVRPGFVNTEDLELAPEAIAAMELGLDFRAIPERPFRAEMVLEIDQRLADGNSMHRVVTSVFYRDQHGRIREERKAERTTEGRMQGFREDTVSLFDPEKGVHYVLLPNRRIGFRMQAAFALVDDMKTRRTTPWTPQPGQKVTTISLGYQMIETLQCEGRRDMVTLPAGSRGNLLPIEVVTDRWFSPELQINLMVRREDPRQGETTIRLTNLRLEEPDKSLFEVPSSFEIREGGTTAIPMSGKQKP